MRKVLDLNADQWATFTHIGRLSLLNNALAIVEDFFGPEGQRWAEAMKKDQKKQRGSELEAKLDAERNILTHGQPATGEAV